LQFKGNSEVFAPWLAFAAGIRHLPLMAEESKSATVADLTLERVRRIEERFDKTDAKIDSLSNKVDALIDLATGTRADFAGFMKLYSDQDGRLAKIDKRLERIEKRLDLVEA
jgi:tetrahydromethanopterin S-methyltransferase subunit G